MNGKTYRASAKTHQPPLLSDDAREQLLYDPDDPSTATLIDHLPGPPRINADGHIEGASGLRATLVVGLPIVAILSPLGYLLGLALD